MSDKDNPDEMRLFSALKVGEKFFYPNRQRKGICTKTVPDHSGANYIAADGYPGLCPDKRYVIRVRT